MAIAATNHQRWQIVTSVIRRIAKIAAHDNRRMIQQRAVSLLDLIEVGQKLIQMFEDILLHPAQAGQQFRLATVVRKRVPAARRTGNPDGSVYPVQGKGDDPS